MKEAIAEKGFQSLEVIVTPYQAEEIRLTQEYHMTEAESDNYIEAPALTFPDVVPYGRNVVYTRNLRRN